MDYRDVLQRKFRKSKTTENYEKFKRQRNKVNNLIKRAKQNYNKNLLDENTKNTTSFWGTLKSIFHTKPKSKLTSTTFKINEEEISTKETTANGLGQFFSSIATKLLQTLHPIKDFVWDKPKDLLIRKHTESTNFHQIYLRCCQQNFKTIGFHHQQIFIVGYSSRPLEPLNQPLYTTL